MFEDSLIESGNRFKAKRIEHHDSFLLWADWPHLRFDPNSFDLYRCAAQAAADDVPGGASSTPAPATPASSRARKGRED